MTTDDRAAGALRLVERADHALAALADPREIRDRLAGLVVPDLADLCVILSADPAPRALLVRHADPRAETIAGEALQRWAPLAAQIARRALDLDGPLRIAIDGALLDTAIDDPLARACVAGYEPADLVAVPFSFPDRARGLAVAIACGPRRFTDADADVFAILTRRLASAYEAEHLRAEGERRTRHFRVLSEAGRLFAENVALQPTLDAFVRLSVPELADAVAVNVLDDDGVVRTAALDARDPAHRDLLAQLRDAYVVDRSLREPQPLDLEDQRRFGTPSWIEPARLPVLRELGYRSSLFIPLWSHGVVRGHLVCHWSHAAAPFDGATLALFEELARRAAIAIENAQMYAREKRIADEVHRALLPTGLPRVDGFTFDAVYSRGARDLESGGDWFDAFELPDGRIVLSIGDVFGHGLAAALVMSKVRQGIRVLALQHSAPDAMLAVVDAALSRDDPSALASAVVGVLDPRAATLTYAIAGHPRPLLRTRDGDVVVLAGSGVPLGLAGGAPPDVQTIDVPTGATLVFYTDGLIEGQRDAEGGEARLRDALGDGAFGTSDAQAHLVRERIGTGGVDDVAVLTIRVDGFSARDANAPPSRWFFRADDARSAEAARAGFVAYLQSRGVEDANYAAAELVFGELVGNVVRHAPGPITVELDWRSDAPVLHVIDRGVPFSVDGRLPESLLSESGRGLFLISVLADEFSVTPLPDYGNHVRVRLRIEQFAGLAALTSARAAGR